MQQQYSDTFNQDTSNQNIYINPAPQQQIIQAYPIPVPQNYQGINPIPQSYPDGYLVDNTNQMANQYNQIPRDSEGLKELMLTQFKSQIQCTNVLLVIRGVKYVPS